MAGAFIVVAVYFPLLNPGMYKAETGRAGEPLGYYLVLTPFPVVILVAAWRFNRRAQALRREEKRDEASA